MKTNKKESTLVGIILIGALIISIVGLAIFLTIYFWVSYDDGLTVTLTKSDTAETVILEGEENVITPDQIELEFTYKDLQEYEIYENAVSKMPSIGNSKMLVLPIEIPGYELTTQEQEQTQEDIYNVFFGDASDTYWESVSSYYYDSSFGQLNITGDVMPWYDATLAGLRSANLLGTTGNISVMDLITSALNYHISNGNVNVDDYDTDGDGYIDALWVIYSAPDYQKHSVVYNYSNYSTYWAYTGWWYGGTGVSSDYSVYAWASLYMIYHHDTITTSTYSSFNLLSSSNQLDSHTLVHETGHILGLNDYYDYNDDESSTSAPAGNNDMMDLNVGDHNMYSKMVLGWVKPYIVTGDASIALATNQYQNSLVIVLDNSSPALSSNGDGTYTFNPFYEYMLVEYYVPEGLNEFDSTYTYTNGAKSITGEGFKVYHIDNRLFVLTYRNGYKITEYTGQSYSSLFYFISNTTGGSNGETALLEYYGISLANGGSTADFDYFTEVQLISSSLYNSYDYKRSYVTSAGYLYLAETSDLFRSGSVFNMSTYSKYFIYGSSGKFNNGHTFNSNIVFS